MTLRSNGAFALAMRLISASMAGKSSSVMGASSSKS